MKKTLLYIAVLGTFIVPSVVSAAWYNPFSWFQKAPVSVVVPVETTSTVPVESPVPTPLPAPKPIITNTITVTDPKLQSQINVLEQQNVTLQTQLSSLTAQYNSLITQNTALNSQIATLQSNSQNSSSVQVSNNLVLNKISTNEDGSIFSLENDSNSIQQIFGVSLDGYTYSSPIQAYISHDTCIDSPITSRSISSSASYGAFSFESPMTLLPHAKENFCVHNGGNVHNIVNITHSGGASVIGTPAQVSDSLK